MYPTMGRHWALGQEQMLENMNVWAKYKLVEIDDVEKRASLCGISVDAVRSGILAIMLDESLEDAQKKARVVLEKGNWPYFYFTNRGKGGMRRKTYLEETDGRMPTNLWTFEEVGHTDGAKKELKAIFSGNIPFDTPKPIALLERIIHIASSSDSIILDFFAGSGTTAHAVLQYNATHKESHRKFILCTNNENGICENITYARIANAINGYNECKGLPANLKYYRNDFVSKDSDDVSTELLKYITEMVQLEHGIKIDNKEYLIILDDDGADNLEQHWDEYPEIKALYISRDVLLTTAQNALFGSVQMHIIPDYYFKFELREVGEAW
ncbi:MAG: site-specific DNA-methyltransferase [Clostridium sp.]|nr:site-specific DNA-methyltransferase [Clostridium sp.]